MKNKILKAMAWLMVLTLLFSVCALDSDSWIPHIVSVLSMSWLALFAYVNRDRLEDL